MIGVAYEISETKSYLKKGQLDEESELIKKYQLVDGYTLTDVFHYSFTHAGLVTGPYFKMRTYMDLCQTNAIPIDHCNKAVLKRLARVPIYTCLFFLSGYIFPLKV